MLIIPALLPIVFPNPVFIVHVLGEVQYVHGPGASEVLRFSLSLLELK
jgi:hypothetical protein